MRGAAVRSFDSRRSRRRVPPSLKAWAATTIVLTFWWPFFFMVRTVAVGVRKYGVVTHPWPPRKTLKVWR